MIITHASIEKFRALSNIDFDLGSKITAIVGHNGTMKTTILGILSQTFTIGPKHIMHGEKTIDGYNFHSQFSEKFKLSDKDIPGEHKWRLDLCKGVYKNDYFEAHSIKRDNKSNDIRFWSTEGKGADTGYPQVPVYYISLKRVTPIGEEKNINLSSELTDEEKLFLLNEYKEIFTTIDTSNYEISTISSTNKHSAAIFPNDQDALTISAGQDNIAKILIAVLSFKRLKDKYPNDYKGGILLIDEIESTFHPMAQKMLIKRIYKYSKDFNIQFIFTTHSPTIIKSTFFDKYNKREAQLLYLKKVDKKVISYNNPPIENVIAELSGEIMPPKKKPEKLTIFCEDNVARSILRQFLKAYNKYISISTCSLGAEEYLELLRVELDPMKKAIIVLDGDKKVEKYINKMKKLNVNNMLFLPSEDCPEKFFYKYLYSLDANDPIWDNSLGGFDKAKCFQAYSTLLDNNADTERYKKWFDTVKSYFGKGCKKLINYWMINNQDEYEKFVTDFKEKFNLIAHFENGEIID